MTEKKEHYLAEFETFDQQISNRQPEWLKEMRHEAIARFNDIGFPAQKKEEWRFTNVAPVLKETFRIPKSSPSPGREELKPFLFPKIACIEVLVTNGKFSGILSSSNLPEGLTILSLREAIEQNNMVAVEHLNRLLPPYDNGFAALNTAFLSDGVFILLGPRVVVDKPVHILCVTTPSDGPNVSFPRMLIVAGRESKLTLLESYLPLSESKYFTNAVTEMVLDEAASVDHLRLEKESERAFHISTTEIGQGRDSRYHSFSLTVGGELTRNDLNVLFDGPGAECSLDGLYLIRANQHADNHTAIDHARPHCTSQQLYKGILSGKSTAVFNGKVNVRKDAQKTNARQTNKNLLLSEGTQVNTKPELEILADDVKCAHGATIGQLEEEAIFYLKSRGIGDAAARSLLTYGFAREVIEQLQVPEIAAQLDSAITNRLQDLIRECL